VDRPAPPEPQARGGGLVRVPQDNLSLLQEKPLPSGQGGSDSAPKPGLVVEPSGRRIGLVLGETCHLYEPAAEVYVGDVPAAQCKGWLHRCLSERSPDGRLQLAARAGAPVLQPQGEGAKEVPLQSKKEKMRCKKT